MPLIQDNDTLAFENSFGEIEYYEIEKNGGYEATDNRFDEYCDMFYNKLENDSLFFGYFSVNIYTMGVNPKSVYESISIEHFSYYYFKSFNSMDEAKSYSQNGYLYTDIYIRDSLNSKNNDLHPIDDAIITKVWYSLKYGIIRYTTKDGEDFKLIRN
ncbi:MAG: hypothetical protein PF590_09380 [Candidatus Delongbacteria bacterium]|nr:hypothetical protein [Candidatus Delongbacteria bacterium]